MTPHPSVTQPTSRGGLPLLEAALLWSVRAWVLGHQAGHDHTVRIQGVYTALHAPTAASALHAMMESLRHGTGRALDVNCVCSPDVTADESLLLDVLALLGQGQHAVAYAILASLVDPWAAAECAGAAAILMAAIGEAGHRMPRTDEALFRHAGCRNVPAVKLH